MKVSVESIKIQEIVIRLDLDRANELHNKLGKLTLSDNLLELYDQLYEAINDVEEEIFALKP